MVGVHQIDPSYTNRRQAALENSKSRADYEATGGEWIGIAA
jgi:hypothetical protein